MSYKSFGNTWWGQAWLNALLHIDYSNRLPRGVRYARNGSVKEIKITRKYISAKVSGTRRTPYSIKIEKEEFSEIEKQKIIEIISSNPFYLSQLASHKLPITLLEDLQKEKIRLFPNSWEDMNAKCSCPDWALCCKHIAAVLYILANEIDMNPFLVFHFHNFDLMKEISNKVNLKNNKADDLGKMIPTLADILKRKADKLQKPKEDIFSFLEAIDLSEIAEIDKDILKTLLPNPLFMSERNFKSDLAKMYKFNKKFTNKFDDSEDKDFKDFVLKKIILDAENPKFEIILKNNKKKESLKNLESINTFVQHTNFADLYEADKSLQILWFTLAFIFHLIKEGAYISQIIQTKEKEFLMRWIPAYFKKKVSEIFTKIISLHSAEIFEIKNSQKLKPDLTESFNFLFSAIVQNIQQKFYDHYSMKYKNNDIFDFFFHKFKYKIDKFDDQEIPKTIHLWLNRFFIVHQDNTPIIKIDESSKNNDFFLEILINMKRSKNEKLVPLHKILTLKKYLKARMQILKDLSHLGDSLPVINKYLAGKAQKPLAVDSDEFVSVWFDSLPVLEILGIETMLPKSLKKIIFPQLSLSMKKKNAEKNIKSYLDLQEILSFDWKIAIGDKFVSSKDFFAQVRHLSGIVKFADQYVLIEQNEIKKLLKASLKEIPNFSAAEILRLGIEEKYENVDLEISNEIRKIFQNIFKTEKIKTPEKLNGELRSYQERGFQWLHNNSKIGFGSIIADDMGLGKTVQVITLILNEKENKSLDIPALVIVPTTLLTNWKKEFFKFAPSLTISTYHGNKRKLEMKSDAIITTYGVARRDKLRLKKKNWKFIIIDEAQNIKNPTTKQTKAVKSLPAKIKIAMTGTPVENRLAEYWSIMDFLNQGLLGNAARFKKEFALPIEKDRNKTKLDQFLKITSPFILRRLKTDRSIIKDLPDKLVTDQYCTLTKEQTAIYQNIVDNTMKILEKDAADDDIQRKGMIFKLMVALKQVCNHPVNYLKKGDVSFENSGKALLLRTLLEEIFQNREKCLVFTQYTEMGNILQQLLADHFDTEILFLHGGVSRKNRDMMVDEFQNDKAKKIFILSLKAGGTGLNLTAANHVVHYDLWWNPAVENQATDRAYRIGQTKNVNVHRFITENTFEEKINNMIIQKKELSELSVQSGEKWISELSNQELKDIIALGE